MKKNTHRPNFFLRPLALACALALSQGDALATGYTVSTLAGDMLYFRDTVTNAAAARYHSPSGLARDLVTGDMYVSDFYNHRIRKIAADGTVTTLAGGTLGTADGVGSNAQFSYPRGLVYLAPFLYVVDNTFNDGTYLDAGTLRRIDTTDGTVTTLAGAPNVQAYTDAVGTGARFKGLQNIAADENGNLLLTDRGNCVIRQYNVSSLMVTTFAGSMTPPDGCTSHDAAATSAGFTDPTGIVFDSYTKKVYVSEPSSHRIRRITTSAGTAINVDTIAGSTQGNTDGPGNVAQFYTPTGMTTVGDGSVYIADTGNNLIRLMDSDGIVSTNGPIRGASLLAPTALSWNGDGALFITEDVDQSGAIQMLDTNSNDLTTYSGRFFSFNEDGAASDATFANPSGIVVDGAGNIYVADAAKNNLGHTLRKITSAGMVSTYAGNPAATGGYLDDIGTAAQFKQPSAVALDGAGNLYVADTGNHFIRKVAPDGTVTTLAGDGTEIESGTNLSGDATTLPLPFPSGVAYDGINNALYVSLAAFDCIRKIDLNGTPAQIGPLAGTCGGESTTSGNADGTGAAATFRSTQGLAYNSSQQMLYVADKGNHHIRKIDVTTGTVTAFAGSMDGSAGAVGSVDGTGSTAMFSSPSGIAFDNGGNLLVADTGNQRIRRVSSTGVVTTIAGSDTGYLDASGTAARFNQPSAVAFNPATGHILVTDTANGVIRALAPPPSFTNFTTVSNAPLNTVVTAAPITLAGFPDEGTHSGTLNCPAGDNACSYSLNGVPNSTAGFKNGDSLTLSVTSSSAYSTTTTATLSIIDLPEALSFSVTTQAQASVPTFPAVTDATPGSIHTSASRSLSGVSASATGTVTCPAGDTHCGAIITSDGVPTTYLANPTASFPVHLGDSVQFQLTAPGTYNSSVTATMTISGLAGTASFTVATGNSPYVPTPSPPTPPIITPVGPTTPVTNPDTVFSNGSSSGATVDGNGAVILPGTPGLTLTLNRNTPQNVAIKPPVNVPVVITNAKGEGIKLTGLGSDTTIVTRKVGNTVQIEVALGTARIEPTSNNVSIPLATTPGQNVATLQTPSSGTPGSLLVRRDTQTISTFIENGKMIYVIQAGPDGVANANVFAAETANNGIAIYSGETAGFSNQGSLSKIRLGSLDGDRNLPGDPLTSSDPDSQLPTTAPGVIVPQLNGGLSRLDGEPITEDIRRQLDQAFGLAGDNSSLSFDPASGVVTYRVGPVDGKTYEGRFMPVGELLVALSGFSDNGFGATNPAQAVSGAFDLSNRGVQLTLSSALGYFTELKSAVKQSDPAGSMLLQANGVLAITLKNELYFTQPGYLVQPGAVTGAPSVEMDGAGLLTFRDSKGSVQTLYPVLGDGEALKTILRAIDPQATLEPLGNGEAKATVGLQEFRLQPQYKMNPLNLPHLYDQWWLDGGYFYYTLPNGRSQAVTIK